MKKVPEISLSEWAQAEEDFAKRFIEPIPEGWYTTSQYAAQCNPPMTSCSASNKLKKMLDAGILERKPWRMGNAKGYIYHPVKKKK